MIENKLISKKEGYKLYYPQHSWDMNYHLLDEQERKIYLIDICDVYDEEDEAEEEGGLLWNDLKSLIDIDYIKEYSWKVKRIY